jgi:hypothetical protein
MNSEKPWIEYEGLTPEELEHYKRIEPLLLNEISKELQPMLREILTCLENFGWKGLSTALEVWFHDSELCAAAHNLELGVRVSITGQHPHAKVMLELFDEKRRMGFVQAPPYDCVKPDDYRVGVA